MKNWVLLFGFALMSQLLMAQTNFTEGRVVYSVYMNNNHSEQKGTLTVTIKGNKLKRVLKINGGMTNTLIMDLDKQETNSYFIMGNGKYATTKSKTEIESENEKFKGASYTPINEQKQIAKYNCSKMQIKYKDGSSNEVYYTSDLISLPALINMFPELKGFPLEYRITAGNTNQIVLVATSVDVITIDNSEFTPLKGFQYIKDANF